MLVWFMNACRTAAWPHGCMIFPRGLGTTTPASRGTWDGCAASPYEFIRLASSQSSLPSPSSPFLGTTNKTPFYLSPAFSAALLTAVDLGDDLTFLTVDAFSQVDFPALLAFILRHRSLRMLCLNLAEQFASPASSGLITSLTTPSMGIPYILPTERSVMDLTVTYAEDSWELPRVLAVIASTQGLPRWFARFPALVWLDFRGRLVPWSEQPAVAQVITAPRNNASGGEWEGVFFSHH
ncbi:hypothetical protein B0H14DRAFT_2581505 [Mycena olivaceomarginata]|nr:hypothetical protein B0H14DRAFT_2581505 [Mycena olivaceomarginata]